MTTYQLATGTVRWERRLDLSGVDDAASIVTIDNGKVFVQSAVESTFALPGCCHVGTFLLQAFSAAQGDLLWQTVGERGESGVYNMVVDRGRLYIPGRAVDPNTNEWDYFVRAYDVRGRKGDIELPFAAPPRLTLTGASGTMSFDVSFEGPMTPSVYGLMPADKQSGQVANDPDDTFDGSGIGETSHSVVVPPGTRHLRVSLANDAVDGNHDLDVYVFGPTGAFVGVVAGTTSAETFDLASPAPGTYRVVVHGFETEGPEANYTLFTWAVGSIDESNLTVSGPAPATATGGTMTINWSGLLPGRRYFGVISYSNGATELARTLVGIKP